MTNFTKDLIFLFDLSSRFIIFICIIILYGSLLFHPVMTFTLIQAFIIMLKSFSPF